MAKRAKKPPAPSSATTMQVLSFFCMERTSVTRPATTPPTIPESVLASPK
jgi:hypothetical protein